MDAELDPVGDTGIDAEVLVDSLHLRARVVSKPFEEPNEDTAAKGARVPLDRRPVEAAPDVRLARILGVKRGPFASSSSTAALKERRSNPNFT